MTAAPAVGPLPSVVPPTADRFTLSNGLEVVTVRREVAPIVSAALMIRSGAGNDAPELSGLASLTAEMLDEGAGTRDALTLADELERLGADLWLGSGRDGSQLSVQAPRDTFFAALDIAGDVLVRPRLTDADWARVLADRKTANAQRRDQPEAVVSVVSDRLLFGDAHPYGRPVEGFARTLERLSLDDVRAFHQTHWRPNHAFLVVAGDFDEESLRARLEAALGAWTGSPPPEPAAPPAWPARPRLCIVDRPGAPQSIVRLVAPGTDRLSPDRPALAMLNAILGGSFTSRLNFNLREQNGFTYGASSSFAFLRRPGSFAARAAVFTESTAAGGPRDPRASSPPCASAPSPTRSAPRRAPRCSIRVAEGLSTPAASPPALPSSVFTACRSTSPLRFIAALERVTADDLLRLAAQLRRPGRRLHRHRRRSRRHRARPPRPRPPGARVRDADGDPI